MVYYLYLWHAKSIFFRHIQETLVSNRNPFCLRLACLFLIYCNQICISGILSFIKQMVLFLYNWQLVLRDTKYCWPRHILDFKDSQHSVCQGHEQGTHHLSVLHPSGFTVCKPCPVGWLLFQSMCYLFTKSTYYSEWKTWEGSRRSCRELSADLVMIDSQVEQVHGSLFFCLFACLCFLYFAVCVQCKTGIPCGEITPLSQ